MHRFTAGADGEQLTLVALSTIISEQCVVEHTTDNYFDRLLINI